MIFDEANGQLRCLTPASGALLAEVVSHAKHTTQELATNLFGSDLTDNDVVLVESALEELATLGLILRVAA